MDDKSGKFNSLLAKTKDNVIRLKDNASQKITKIVDENRKNKEEKDFKKLHPLFENEISASSLQKERIIRVVNYDSRLENKVCKGSIGFFEMTKSRKVPTIYSQFIDRFNFNFYPKLSDSVFISDPCVEGKFIEVDEYYNYMKQVRVNELTVIAQALGAKHVEIALSVSSDTSSASSIKANLSARSKILDSNNKIENRISENTQIWSSTDFDTSNFDGVVVMPDILYFKNESNISALIQMVVVNKTKLSRRTYRMKSTSSSGLSFSDSTSISLALKSIKFGGGFEFEKSSIKDSNSFLEYTIEF